MTTLACFLRLETTKSPREKQQSLPVARQSNSVAILEMVWNSGRALAVRDSVTMASETLNHQVLKKMERKHSTLLGAIRLVVETMGLGVLLEVLEESQDRCLSTLATMLSVVVHSQLLISIHPPPRMRHGKREKHGKTTLGPTAAVPAGRTAREKDHLGDTIRQMARICSLEIHLITAQEVLLDERGIVPLDKIDTTAQIEAEIEAQIDEKRIEQMEYQKGGYNEQGQLDFCE